MRQGAYVVILFALANVVAAGVFFVMSIVTERMTAVISPTYLSIAIGVISVYCAVLFLRGAFHQRGYRHDKH